MRDTEAKPPTDDDLDDDLTPRENLAMAVRYARAHMMCPAGSRGSATTSSPEPTTATPNAGPPERSWVPWSR